MIKHVKKPFLHLEIKDGNCEVTGRGNTWQYFLLFAFIVKEAKEGKFTEGFDSEREKKEIIRILDKVYERPGAAIKAFSQLGDVNAVSDILEALDRLFEGDYVDGE
jgi:hypothetical protein|nr:MAG TPA: hypothetical protein [Caudoviricetes sp.]